MKHILPALALAFAGGLALTSCDDMLDMGNDDMLYADENHLSQANDTVNSFVGILAQLQKIAVRTNLYGELRGDLSVVNANADADLKAIANFQVSSDNVYNDPRDYYAVINNCNYYLANADTTISETTLSGSGRTDFYPFRAEYVAVRTIRAWVYLQLGQVYGTNIPLVTKPILSLEDADEQLANAPKKDLGGLCDYFIDDLKPYVAWFDYPAHGKYNDEMPARMAVLPIQLVLGDLYLWSASIHNDPMLAREAAKSYYDYIDWVPSYGGVESNNAYKVKNTIGNATCSWLLGYGTFTGTTYRSGISSWFDTSAFGNNRGNSSEVIASIGMDSASSEGYFNQLRYLYCYDNDRDTEASISPSQVCYDLSDSQNYMAIYTPANSERTDTQFVTRDMLPVTMQERHYQGDLRLPSVLNLVQRADHDNQSQIIYKHYVGTGMAKVQDIIVYRTGDVYLRLAEALNYAGFPKFALCILTTGLDERVMDYLVLPQCTTAADSAFVSYFEFPRAYYQTRVSGITFRNGVTLPQISYSVTNYNQIGLHERGAGTVADNKRYYDPVEVEQPLSTEGAPQPLPPFVAPTNLGSGAVIMDSLYTQNPELMNFIEAYAEAYPEDVTIPTIETSGNAQNFLNDAKDFIATARSFWLYTYGLWQDAYSEWYRDNAAPQVKARMTAVADSLIDLESALETPFEGFRFGYLMRASYRKNDPTFLAKKVAARDASLLGLLSDRNNWFVSWKGQKGTSIGR